MRLALALALVFSTFPFADVSAQVLEGPRLLAAPTALPPLGELAAPSETWVDASPRLDGFFDLESLHAAPEPPPSPGAEPVRKPLRPAAVLPHLVTGMNLASGVAATIAAAHGSVGAAAGLIMLGNFFDMMDGRLARALGVAGDLGIELDSLADVVTFGAAPAVLIHQAALHAWGPAGFALSGAYALAGAYRLARFNLMALGKRGAGPRPPDTFVGLPIPAGAGLIAGAALALGGGSGPSTLLAAGLTAAAAAAMASTLPYPAFKKAGFRKLAAVGALALPVVAALAAFGLVRWAPLALFGAYAASVPLKKLLRRVIGTR